MFGLHGKSSNENRKFPVAYCFLTYLTERSMLMLPEVDVILLFYWRLNLNII